MLLYRKVKQAKDTINLETEELKLAKGVVGENITLDIVVGQAKEIFDGPRDTETKKEK